MLTVGDLFSGIGGFSLGLERAGMRTAWFAEVDPYASAVLRKHWPDVPNHGDVRSIRRGTVERVDVLCGGFPCQPTSSVGKRLGREDNRWLWPEYRRLIEELEPTWVFGENVIGLVSMELDNVLADLEGLGYSARTFDIPACAVGAHHERRRAWIVAHRGGERLQGVGAGRNADSADGPLARRAIAGGIDAAPAAADSDGGERSFRWTAGRVGWRQPIQANGHWEIASEPFVRRGVHGIPRRMDRIRCLGNAIVPQVAEIIGRAIVSASYKENQSAACRDGEKTSLQPALFSATP